MTLGEFKTATAHLSDDTDLFIGERLTEFRYGLVNSAQFRNIRMSQNPYEVSDEDSKQDAIILEED